jgi:competence protein ComEA
MGPDDRVEDLVIKAGGFTPDSDPSRLNLAVKLHDEMQVVVPARSPSGTASPSGGITLAPDSVANQATTTKGKGATPTPTPGKMNINTASADELENLPGIGEVLAQRIVEYRTKNGPFKMLIDLKKVQGVTNATLDKVKDLIIF